MAGSFEKQGVPNNKIDSCIIDTFVDMECRMRTPGGIRAYIIIFLFEYLN